MVLSWTFHALLVKVESSLPYGGLLLACEGTSSWSSPFSTGLFLGVDDNPCSVADILNNIIIIIIIAGVVLPP